MAANGGLPPGASKGVVAGKELAGHSAGATTSSGLDGHTSGNLGAVAPARMEPPDTTTSSYALGSVPD